MWLRAVYFFYFYIFLWKHVCKFHICTLNVWLFRTLPLAYTYVTQHTTQTQSKEGKANTNNCSSPIAKINRNKLADIQGYLKNYNCDWAASRTTHKISAFITQFIHKANSTQTFCSTSCNLMNQHKCYAQLR